MYLEGENDFNFANTYARVVPDDETGLELRGEFMGGEMQEGILSVDETGGLRSGGRLHQPAGQPAASGR